jgi:hypothetical protein
MCLHTALLEFDSVRSRHSLENMLGGGDIFYWNTQTDEPKTAVTPREGISEGIRNRHRIESFSFAQRSITIRIQTTWTGWLYFKSHGGNISVDNALNTLRFRARGADPMLSSAITRNCGVNHESPVQLNASFSPRSDSRLIFVQFWL